MTSLWKRCSYNYTWWNLL